MTPVKDLSHLYSLAQEKRSITLFGGPPGWIGYQGHTPAAWAINWTGQMIHRLLPYMFVVDQAVHDGRRGLRTDHRK
jgi:hypothetical protein